MSEIELQCPVPGCRHDAKFIRYECEEVPVPAVMSKDPVKRKLPFGVLARNFLVECPIHGLQNVQETGHHIRTIPKKSTKVD